MSRKKILDQVGELPSEQKAVFWGSVAMAVSAILPWYSDIDAFRTGDTYYGVTGPLYLVGLLFLVCGVVMAMSLLNYTIRDKVERIFSKLSTFYLMAGGFCGFLLLLANSVYFHPKFGVNISIKESRFGMLLALAGVVVVFAGAYMLRKRQVRYAHLDEKLEPLIEMNSQEDYSSRETARLPVERQHTPVERQHPPIGMRTHMSGQHVSEQETESHEPVRQDPLL